MIDFIKIDSLLGCKTFEEVERNYYEQYIYYADKNKQNVIDSIDKNEMKYLDYCLFDGWYIAFYRSF